MDTRAEFTNAISKLPFVITLNGKEKGRLYAKFTNLVYLNLQDVELDAQAYKKKHGLAKREIAKHYFKKDGLLDLEKIESKLAAIIEFNQPSSEIELDELFEKFFNTLAS